MLSLVSRLGLLKGLMQGEHSDIECCGVAVNYDECCVVVTVLFCIVLDS